MLFLNGSIMDPLELVSRMQSLTPNLHMTFCTGPHLGSKTVAEDLESSSL